MYEASFSCVRNFCVVFFLFGFTVKLVYWIQQFSRRSFFVIIFFFASYAFIASEFIWKAAFLFSLCGINLQNGTENKRTATCSHKKCIWPLSSTSKFFRWLMVFEKLLYFKYFINTEHGIHIQRVSSSDEGESLHQIKFDEILQVPNIVTNILFIAFLLLRSFCRINFLSVPLFPCNRYSLSILFLICMFMFRLSSFRHRKKKPIPNRFLGLISFRADWKKRRPFSTIQFVLNAVAKRCRNKMNSLSKTGGFPFWVWHSLLSFAKCTWNSVSFV